MKLPSGRQIAAARMLLGWQQKDLAKRAKLDPSTITRMEASGGESVRGHGRNIQAVLDALTHGGVEITADGIRLVPKPKR